MQRIKLRMTSDVAFIWGTEHGLAAYVLDLRTVHLCDISYLHRVLLRIRFFWDVTACRQASVYGLDIVWTVYHFAIRVYL